MKVKAKYPVWVKTSDTHMVKEFKEVFVEISEEFDFIMTLDKKHTGYMYVKEDSVIKKGDIYLDEGVLSIWPHPENMLWKSTKVVAVSIDFSWYGHIIDFLEDVEKLKKFDFKKGDKVMGISKSPSDVEFTIGTIEKLERGCGSGFCLTVEGSTSYDASYFVKVLKIEDI